MSNAPVTAPTRQYFDVADHRRSARERYGLVVVLAWIGLGKYVKFEARILIEHSPMMSWSFLFTAPGLFVAHRSGIPVLGAQPGQFLQKDRELMGVALWTLGDSLSARRVTPKAVDVS